MIGSLSARPSAQTAEPGAAPVKTRHLGALRERATKLPRSEGDQAVVDSWPLYRTERGQAAFNDAMATLKATDAAAPTARAFKGCAALDCHLTLPPLTADGWLQPGRLWISPNEYVLVALSPRLREGQSYRRRAQRDMRYFVFHEFHNSSRNTDMYDTVSAHRSVVFVPFYLSKSATDARGRRFVVVLQVAPHDVASIHASNRGSAGPGIEVAKNASETVEPLQVQAGILVASIVKAAAPRLEVVNHHGSEGLAMLHAYERRIEVLRSRPAAPSLALPFTPASAPRIAAVSGTLDDVIARRGSSPRLPLAARTFVPPNEAAASLLPAPKLIGPIRLAVRPPRGTESSNR